MSEFGGMDELLQDFLTESSELLSDVDNKLVELERRPDDKTCCMTFSGAFTPSKGGAGFLNVSPLVTLCHRTENLFDKLRNSEIQLSPEVMDVILEATGVVRDMFDVLRQGRMPESADPMLLEALDRALKADQPITVVQLDPLPTPVAPPPPQPVARRLLLRRLQPAAAPAPAAAGAPDWQSLYHAVVVPAQAVPAAAPAPVPAAAA